MQILPFTSDLLYLSVWFSHFGSATKSWLITDHYLTPVNMDTSAFLFTYGYNVCVHFKGLKERWREKHTKPHNKAHHWVTSTPPYCTHSFPAFQRAWVGSRVSSDDFNSGEGSWWNLQPSVTQRIPHPLTLSPLYLILTWPLPTGLPIEECPDAQVVLQTDRSTRTHTWSALDIWMCLRGKEHLLLFFYHIRSIHGRKKAM